MTVTLWVLIENLEDPGKFELDNDHADLDSLKTLLLSQSEVLKGIHPPLDKTRLQFFIDTERIQKLASSTLLRALETTSEKPLILRYPFSDNRVSIRINLGRPWLVATIPHNSGMWFNSRQRAIDKFDVLKTDPRPHFFFFNNDTQTEITNEYEFNDMVEQISPNDNKVRQVSVTVRVEGMKAYSEWNLSEITRTLFGEMWDSIDSTPKFDKDELPKPEKEIEVPDGFYSEIRRKLEAFQTINNEPTVREFTSPFLTTAVVILKKNQHNLKLNAEINLQGSRGFGPVDYSIESDGILVIVIEVKKEDFDQGTAQAFAQMHSAVEALEKKRKLDQTDFEEGKFPVMMYGIVTNSREWVFIRWVGDSKEPKIAMTTQLPCPFDGDLSRAKEILEYIIGILESQINSIITPYKKIK
ncbi:18098_t:CDS:2, partial [Cetraspora pellucida]